MIRASQRYIFTTLGVWRSFYFGMVLARASVVVRCKRACSRVKSVGKKTSDVVSEYGNWKLEEVFE